MTPPIRRTPVLRPVAGGQRPRGGPSAPDAVRGGEPGARTGRFADRADAGWRLAERLERFRDADPVVLGLPRGGVPVAYQVATALDAPLEVIVVRKLGVPYQPEVAMGAIGEDGTRVLDRRVLDQAGVSGDEFVEVERRERQELGARLRRYRRGRPRHVVFTPPACSIRCLSSLVGGLSRACRLVLCCQCSGKPHGTADRQRLWFPVA